MDEGYRVNARLALNRARDALDSGEIFRLRYAALELRMALECLVYERAQRYKEELPTKKLSTWQPKQLLNILLAIDPYADKTSTIRYGVQEAHGVPAKNMTTLGTDRMISLKEIKEYYDRLGSYLHSPTIEQTEKRKGIPDDKLRISCEDLFKVVESSLASKVWNSDLKETTSIACIDCGTKVVRRVRSTEDRYAATCMECEASYTLTRGEDGKFMWKEDGSELECVNPDCREKLFVLERDVALGKHWACRSCGGENAFALGVRFTPKALG